MKGGRHGRATAEFARIRIAPDNRYLHSIRASPAPLI
jgi:hypothetical protein